MKISVAEICSNNKVTREDGKKIRNLIQNNWEKENSFTIDFGKLLIASVSFIDEAFGKLINEYPVQELKGKLKFQNMLKYDRDLLRDILRSRSKQKQLAKA